MFEFTPEQRADMTARQAALQRMATDARAILAAEGPVFRERFRQLGEAGTAACAAAAQGMRPMMDALSRAANEMRIDVPNFRFHHEPSD